MLIGGVLFLLDPIGSIQDSDRVSWEDVSLDPFARTTFSLVAAYGD